MAAPPVAPATDPLDVYMPPDPSEIVLVPGRLDVGTLRELARRYPDTANFPWHLVRRSEVQLQLPRGIRFDEDPALARKRRAIIRWARAEKIPLPAIEDWHTTRLPAGNDRSNHP